MDSVTWIFSGIGTTLVCGFIGWIVNRRWKVYRRGEVSIK